MRYQSNHPIQNPVYSHYYKWQHYLRTCLMKYACLSQPTNQSYHCQPGKYWVDETVRRSAKQKFSVSLPAIHPSSNSVSHQERQPATSFIHLIANTLKKLTSRFIHAFIYLFIHSYPHSVTQSAVKLGRQFFNSFLIHLVICAFKKFTSHCRTTAIAQSV
jgi:hypothetical protein